MKYSLVAINLTNVTEELQSQQADGMTFLTSFASVGRLEGSNYKSLQ